MREYLSELVRIAPFSVDTLSGGRPQLFQLATVASSVSTRSGFADGLIGILFFAKKTMKLSLIILSLNCLLNGPMYDTNAEARRTSPMITFKYYSRSTMDWFHLSYSLPRAFTSL